MTRAFGVHYLAVTLIHGLAVSFVILKVIDKTVGLRVAEDQEREDLDTPCTGKVSNNRE